MISCPDALWHRLKFISLYLGFDLTEISTGHGENQRSCKRNSTMYVCQIGKR